MFNVKFLKLSNIIKYLRYFRKLVKQCLEFIILLKSVRSVLFEWVEVGVVLFTSTMKKDMVVLMLYDTINANVDFESFLIRHICIFGE